MSSMDPFTALAVYIDELNGSLDDKSKHILDTCRPSMVVLAGGPDGLAAHAPKLAIEVKQHLPKTRLGLNIGCDTWSAKLVKGQCSLDQASDKLVSGVTTCLAIGGELPIFDPEGEEEGSQADPICKPLASLTLKKARALHPGVWIAHSSFDVPAQVQWTDENGIVRNFGGNLMYPWFEWCGDGIVSTVAPIERGADEDIPQVYYGASDTAPPASTSSALWRLQRHLDSWQIMYVKKLIARAATQSVYVQLHGQTPGATAIVMDRYMRRIGWASPGEADTNGVRGFGAMCKLERLGLTIAEFQTAHGLVADSDLGHEGSKTLAALDSVADPS